MNRPATASRMAMVPGPRLSGWVDRFRTSHGAVHSDFHDDNLLLTAADGTTALLKAPWPVDGRPGRGSTDVERLAAMAGQERGLGLVLVRRGGFALAAASGPLILASATGKRHVEAKVTAGQAASLFAGNRIEYIVPGGDRTLVDQVLAHPALKAFAGRTRLALLDVQEPKAANLAKAAADACSVRITVSDPRN